MKSNWFSGLDSNQQCLKSKDRCSACTATADRIGSGGWNRTTVRASSELGRDASNPRLNKLAGRLGLEPSKVGFGDQPPRLRSTQILAERTVAATDTREGTHWLPTSPGASADLRSRDGGDDRSRTYTAVTPWHRFQNGQARQCASPKVAEGGVSKLRSASPSSVFEAATGYLPATPSRMADTVGFEPTGTEAPAR